MTPRRQVLNLCVVLLIMIDTLKRFSDSTAYSVSMWVMEFLVLSLIAYEVFTAISRDRKIRNRLEVLFEAMNKGQELQRRPPSVHEPSLIVSEWKTSANSWIENTQTLLRSYSPQAEASFLHDPHTIPPNYPAPWPEYHLLVVRLNNLRGIMEKPEVYF